MPCLLTPTGYRSTLSELLHPETIGELTVNLQPDQGGRAGTGRSLGVLRYQSPMAHYGLPNC